MQVSAGTSGGLSGKGAVSRGRQEKVLERVAEELETRPRVIMGTFGWGSHHGFCVPYF